MYTNVKKAPQARLFLDISGGGGGEIAGEIASEIAGEVASDRMYTQARFFSDILGGGGDAQKNTNKK